MMSLSVFDIGHFIEISYCVSRFKCGNYPLSAAELKMSL